ncbi:Baeyer-Villiger monooxygenase [Candida viswanathii]|jgi:cation diffusion facilitator CzcD-associated flavoprotein CzcO|uniref:Baeyer-Villiger monooxygenase n=1 Tax=Candida viswanathii TaxID=5486 RepID=A0A367XP25_9ASCO|nr:Baeyer-Villiger monooxygenase [Candida viswanathii]
MSAITLTKESHKHPEKFRIRYEDSTDILGPHRKDRYAYNESLPVKETSSKLAIIGAGFGGLATSIKALKHLKEEDFVIFERHDNFGGTWYANTYVGCASDIPAVFYSLSEVLVKNWSRVQPPQYEMEEYILRVVDQFKLREKAVFETEINQCEWNDDEGVWVLTAHNVKTGQKIVHKSQLLVACQGGLVHPNEFNVEGLDTFKGEYMHSALWNHNVDFKNKNVIVIGNGCSANQIVPSLLNNPDYSVGSLTQIIRSKHYVMHPVPGILQWLYNLLSFNYYGILFVRWLVVIFAEARIPLFKGEGLLARFVRWINTRAAVHYMRTRAPKKFHDMIIPNYKIGCKRLIFDYNYIPSLNDPRVDIKNSPIDKIVENGILLKNGELIEADIIVACTGYNVIKSYFNYKVVGRNGTDINKSWKDEGPGAYRTLQLKECPNFWMIAGPNSATGHSSVVMAIENGVDYFAKTAKPILDGKAKSVRVTNEGYDKWFNAIQAELKKSVFGTPFGGCTSWYSNDKVNATAYAWSQAHYWWITHFPNYKELIYDKSESKKSI